MCAFENAPYIIKQQTIKCHHFLRNKYVCHLASLVNLQCSPITMDAELCLPWLCALIVPENQIKRSEQRNKRKYEIKETFAQICYESINSSWLLSLLLVTCSLVGISVLFSFLLHSLLSSHMISRVFPFACASPHQTYTHTCIHKRCTERDVRRNDVLEKTRRKKQCNKNIEHKFNFTLK